MIMNKVWEVVREVNNESNNENFSIDDKDVRIHTSFGDWFLAAFINILESISGNFRRVPPALRVGICWNVSSIERRRLE